MFFPKSTLFFSEPQRLCSILEKKVCRNPRRSALSGSILVKIEQNTAQNRNFRIFSVHKNGCFCNSPTRSLQSNFTNETIRPLVWLSIPAQLLPFQIWPQLNHKIRNIFGAVGIRKFWYQWALTVQNTRGSKTSCQHFNLVDFPKKIYVL